MNKLLTNYILVSDSGNMFKSLNLLQTINILFYKLQILELCPLLQSLWRLEIEGKLTEDDIAELEDKYMKTHLALNSILELIKENASELSTVHCEYCAVF